MRSEKELPEKHKSKLYPAVLELFANNDFHQVTVRLIAEKSKVSVGTLYKYFSSKEDIIFTIIDEHVRKIGELRDIHVQGLQSTKEIFRKMLWVVMDYYDKYPEVAIAAFINIPMRSWMHQESYTTGRESLFTIVKDAHQRGDMDPEIDVRRFRDIYYMICYRVIHRWYYHGMKWKLADAIQKDFNIYWKLLRPKK